MRKLFSIHKRTIGLGLMGALVLALAVLGGLLWAGQSASAQPEGGVTIKHVNPDGSDYAGNPYCPSTIWAAGVPITVDVTDDCNNITSQNHVIRTDGWVQMVDGIGMIENPLIYPGTGWHIENDSGANAIVVAEARCGDLAEVISRPDWDSANDDEECVIIHSSSPGETRVTKGYWECVEDDPVDCAQFTTDGVVKEWDSLVDSVILKEPDLGADWNIDPPGEGIFATGEDPADTDGDTDVDVVDHHLADHQGDWENDNVVFDEATKRIRSLDGAIRLVEIVHGEHDVRLNGDTTTLNHPTEGAIFLATIDSTRGCTYFTDPTGVENFGDAMNGISTGGGRFLGPHTAPDVTQPIWLNDLLPDSHNGTSVQGDWDFLDIWVDTICEEQATITIDAGYPDTPGSLRLPTHEEISINWVTIEQGKQPVIRWAGEEIVLETRWALPDMWFPNPSVGSIVESGTQCDNAIDDDHDGLINDGCPAVGATSESTIPGACDNDTDDDVADADDMVNDGCPVNAAGATLPVCPVATLYDVDGDGLSVTDVDDVDALHLVDGDGNGSLDTILSYYAKYIRFDPSPGGLVGGYTDPDHDGYLNSGYASDGAPDWAISPIDKQCHSKALYGSQEPGEVDVEATLIEFRYHCDADADAPNPAWVDYNTDGYLECWDAVVDPPASGHTWTDEHLVNKHAFLVWYLKIYQVKLTNVPGIRADHNSGLFGATSPASISDPTKGDKEADTLNVSADALLRVRVKGFIRLTDLSSRGDVCIDIDGDGDGVDNDGDTVQNEDKLDGVDNDGDTKIDEDLEAGAPYPAVTHTGCPLDLDDEMVAGGYWVLPDDLVRLAGGDPSNVLPNWDVMSDIDETPTSLSGSGYYIGLKSTLDSHDAIVRPNVPCISPYCGRKTVDPDQELTVADAIMPPLKITAQIKDPADAGFLKEANKVDDLGITSLYSSIMIPYEPEIPWWVTNGGYDWDSWYCRLQHLSGPNDPDGSCPTLDLGLALGPYEFYDVLNILPAPGPLENTDVGNQDGQTADDPTHPRKFQFYTDNRGEGFFFANGDYNLDFGLDSSEGCTLQAYSGTPDCEEGDKVGTSTIQVNADYPYFRGKWANVNSNPVIKTWEWGGFKSVSAVVLDASHLAIIAHLKDRDGFCKFDVGTDPTVANSVVFSPSEHEVQHEDILFTLNTDVGSIKEVSGYAALADLFSPLGETEATAYVPNVVDPFHNSAAIALAEDERILDYYDQVKATVEADECQAWIVIQHPADQNPDVSVTFHDPEGDIERHWPEGSHVVKLAAGWNDTCYTDREQATEDALTAAGILDDVVVVWRYDAAATKWYGFIPDRTDIPADRLTTVKPYDQLWIATKTGEDWLMVETQTVAPPGERQLVKGWNSECYVGNTKPVLDATASMQGDFQILYTLDANQLWWRYAPGRTDLTNLVQLNKFASVFILVTAADGTTWTFDP